MSRASRLERTSNVDRGIALGDRDGILLFIEQWTAMNQVNFGDTSLEMVDLQKIRNGI